MNPPHGFGAGWHPADFNMEAAALARAGITWSLPPFPLHHLPESDQVQILVERIRSTPRIDLVLFLLAPLNREVIQALPRTCRHLQRVGIGLEKVDAEAA